MLGAGREKSRGGGLERGAGGDDVVEEEIRGVRVGGVRGAEGAAEITLARIARERDLGWGFAGAGEEGRIKHNIRHWVSDIVLRPILGHRMSRRTSDV